MYSCSPKPTEKCEAQKWFREQQSISALSFQSRYVLIESFQCWLPKLPNLAASPLCPPCAAAEGQGHIIPHDNTFQPPQGPAARRAPRMYFMVVTATRSEQVPRCPVGRSTGNRFSRGERGKQKKYLTTMPNSCCLWGGT